MFVDRIELRNFKSFRDAKIKLVNGVSCVIGPNGSGKCVRGDSLVWLASGETKTIEELVETALENGSNAEMDDGTLTLDNPLGISVWSLNPETLQMEEKMVQAFVKRSSPNELYEVTTRTGNKIVATGYHPLMTLQDGKLAALKAEELREGTFIAAPRRMEFRGRDYSPLRELIEWRTGLYVEAKPLEKRMRRVKNEKGRTWKQLAEDAGVPLNAVKGLLDGQSIEVYHANKLARIAGLSETEKKELFKDVHSRNSRKKTRIPTELTPELARFLGYVVSEGRVVENEVFFYNSDENLLKDFENVARKTFNCTVTRCNYKGKEFVVVPSKTVYKILEKCFGFKKNQHSREKTISKNLENAETHVIAEFLSALYDGDGTIHGSQVSYCTASEALAQGIKRLLLRTGVTASLKPCLKCATNTDKKIKRKYYRVTAYGKENAAKLAGHLKLLSKEKHKRLLKLALRKKTCKATDLVPGVNKEIRNYLKNNGFSDRKLKKIKQGRIRAYYENRCLPTRAGLKAVARLLNGVGAVTEAEEVSCLAESGVYWDKVTSIKKVDGEQWVYDLCVEGNHNFLCEGLFVHNSNVVDALMFAFGESRLRSMRVKKSTDLIFHNAKAGEAVVEFREGDKTHPVKRALKRDGKTRYLLDGKRVKKYVIDEFLAKHNISMNNVIKQGEVQRIVEMSGNERRELIDFVANISEYEEKKEEALKELAKVEATLKEARLVLSDKEGFLAELKAEKEAAEKYVAYDKEFKECRATTAETDAAALEKEFKELIEKAGKADEQENALKARLKEVEAALEKTDREKDEVNGEITERSRGRNLEVQREMQEYFNALERAKAVIEDKREVRKRLEERLRDKNVEVTRAGGELQGVERLLKTAEEELESISKILDSEEGKLNALQSKEKTFSQEFLDAKKTIQECEEGMAKARERLGELQGELAALQATKDAKEKELERLRRGFAGEDFEQQKKELERLENAAQKELGAIDRRGNELFERENKLNQRNAEIEEKLLEAKEKVSEHRGRLQHAGTKGLSEAQAAQELKENVEGVYGTVRELCSFPEEYAVPVAVALANRLGFIVVADVDAAGKAIDYLKRNDLGRLSFIPLNKIKARPLNAEEKALAKKPGAIRHLIDLLKYDSTHEKAMQYACGNTLLMESFDDAKKLVRKARLVTLKGELLESSGLVTGGKRSGKAEDAFAEKAALDKWSKQVERTAAEREAAMQSLQALRDEVNAFRKDRTQAEVALKEVQIRKQNRLDREKSWLSQNADVEKACNDLKKEAKACESQAEEKGGEKSALIRRMSELNVKLLNAKQKVDVEAEQKFGNLLKEKQHQVGELKIALKQREVEADSQKTKKKVLEGQLASLKRQLDDFKAEDDDARKAMDAADETIKDSRKQISALKEEQKELSKGFEELVDKREALAKKAEKLEGNRAHARNELDDLDTGRRSTDARKVQVKTRLADAKARLAEFAGVKCLQGKTRVWLISRANELDDLIKEMGAVNLRAIETYSHKAADLEKQQERVGILEKERTAVMAIMEAIDRKKTATFMKAFDEVNDSFQKLFSKIFTGNGMLYLENPDNPLDGGLTIQVELTNKEVMYLELMSGGEKSLIALLFLFAIQSANPSSVYILDEADAALDQENSRKLAALLKALSRESQFIVVTHNENVYKAADCLIGVAMHGRQGSKVVEVNLNDAKKLVNEGAGEKEKSVK